jgi:glycosyltransferase involved in cell wall biosynthesis
MRILIVLHQFFPEFLGGTERVALNLARTAQRAGHHVRVLACALQADACDGLSASALPGAVDTVYEGVPITLLPRKSLPVTADYSFDCAEALIEPLQSWMRALRFDVLHLIHPMRMATAIKAAQNIGLPYVVTLTDFYWFCNRINLVNLDGQLCSGPQCGQQCAKSCNVPPWDAPSLTHRHRQAAAILASAGACVAPSKYVAQRYQAAFEGLQVKVIPHGIDLLALLRHTQADRAPVVPFGAEPLTLGYIGTIVSQKGLLVLLQALAMIPELPLRLLVAGRIHGDAVYKDHILRLAAADARVNMLGQLDAAGVGGMLQSLDLLCLPSIIPESYSLVLHESAAVGVPALVSRLGAPSDFMSETQAGQAIDAGDPVAWAQAISNVQQQPALLATWRAGLPLPIRVEEEAFLYEALYRQFRKQG